MPPRFELHSSQFKMYILHRSTTLKSYNLFRLLSFIFATKLGIKSRIPQCEVKPETADNIWQSKKPKTIKPGTQKFGNHCNWITSHSKGKHFERFGLIRFRPFKIIVISRMTKIIFDCCKQSYKRLLLPSAHPPYQD